MSNSAKPTGPLTVGNSVSAGLRIYRDRFKTYYTLALKAYLWILIPIYGWAKFWAIQGLISRLAFAEINEQPETVREAEGEVMPRMWSFLGAGILTNLIIAVFLCAFAFFSLIIILVLLVILFGVLSYEFNAEKSGGFLGNFIVFMSPFSIIWLASRLFLVETILAVENELNACKAISRCWKLTKGSLKSIQWIMFISCFSFIFVYLILLIYSIIRNLVFKGLSFVFTQLLSMASTDFLSDFFSLLSIGVVVAIFALLIPFWQCIKAVTYYDIRNRCEGLDLKLKDRAQ